MNFRHKGTIRVHILISEHINIYLSEFSPNLKLESLNSPTLKLKNTKRIGSVVDTLSCGGAYKAIGLPYLKTRSEKFFSKL